ncbi:expressed unknown protein [Seminavis robusta]|uniref:Uncharacterized protein n=1 Tax=Seminavis robusta TaxID=568900 RepID=A0A9N8DLQ8_9STRA|nr:expressed unknown protein [Seminavis robusta]|eukprot:Sro229_g092980.1 n/a (614) ;mRNA; r:31513-33354
MWGFSSRKDQDSQSTDNDDHKMSPSKRSRRRIGGKKKEKGPVNDKGSATSGAKKAMGALSFSRSNGSKQQQHPPLNEQAPGLNSSQQELEWRNQNDAEEQEQDINVDVSDDQGIEILLDMSTHNHNNPNPYAPRHPKSPATKSGHHSRRSMSNHKTKDRRSAPPDPKRQTEPAPSSLLSPMVVSDNSKTVVSLEHDVLVKRTKIYRAQFSIFFPIPTLPSDPLAHRDQRRHRIPLGGRGRVDGVAYNDQIRMLQNSNPLDEITSVRMELKKMKMEIDALEEDKEALEQRWLTLNQQQRQQYLGAGARSKQSVTGTNDTVDWDIHRLLSSKRKLSNKERTDFEVRRGNCVTVYLQNPRAEDAFLSKCCGAKQIPPKKTRRRVITVDPQNCRPGGAGATIRHLALLPKGSSFFVSRDNGKSYSWGQLPPRLLQRMKSQGLDPVKHCGELLYLSTGPNGYYYAEFSTGECWWGCAGEDKEFYEILQHWEIYRVVFGASVKHTAVNGNSNQTREVLTNSWIILGRDGRAAWKNLPSRLHQTLESRLANSAAPAEVALGSGDSYYVRFLDGTVDYCLPAELAAVCERIQRSGGVITDMALNPEASHEFMVRHTEIPTN